MPYADGAGFRKRWNWPIKFYYLNWNDILAAAIEKTIFKLATMT
jgi:hypothetical protein